VNRLVALVPTRGQVASLQASLVDFSWMHWAALPVTDRRWTAPLLAIALGFGLFIGVGLSPGVDFSNGTIPIVAAAESPAASEGGGNSATSTDGGAPALGSPVANAGPPPPSPAVGPSASAPVPTAPTTPPPTTTTTAPTTTTTTETTTPTTPTDDTDDDAIVVKGAVIHVNSEADSYAVASNKGQLSAVHARKLPDVGTKVEVPVRTLANGTYAEDGKLKSSGHADTAEFQGLVTFVDPVSGNYTVSRRGSSIYVRLDPAGDAEPPTVASLVTVEVAIAKVQMTAPEPVPTEPPPTDPAPRTAPLIDVAPVALPDLPQGCGARPAAPGPPETTLVERSRESGSEFLGYSDFEGIVQGVCPDLGVLMLSADDAGEAGADLALAVGDDAGIDLDTVEPGDVVDATATIEEGTLTLGLTGLSAEGGVDEADDADLAQGDQAG
jgi:hypothetical protein